MPHRTRVFLLAQLSLCIELPINGVQRWHFGSMGSKIRAVGQGHPATADRLCAFRAADLANPPSTIQTRPATGRVFSRKVSRPRPRGAGRELRMRWSAPSWNGCAQRERARPGTPANGPESKPGPI